MEEWKNQLDHLQDVQKKIVPLFDHVPKNSAYERWHKMMGNPLRQTAVYTLEPEDFTLLRDTLQDLFSDAQVLYQSNGRIDLMQHFKRLRALLEAKAASSLMREEEREAANRILKRLDINTDDPEEIKKFKRRMPIENCSSNNLAEAMGFFLRGDLDKAAEAEVDGQELATGARSGLSDIEAEFLKEKVHPIHVCFCDDKHVPGGSRPYAWPLSKKFFEELALKLTDSSKHKAGLCEDYIYYMESGRLAGRYLFFLALQFPEVKVSWVEEYGSEKLNGTAYLKLLASDKEGNDKDPLDTDTSVFCLKDKLITENEVSEFLPFDVVENSLPDEIEYNRQFCPVRNLYDYGLQRYPGIESEFQLDFYSSMLLRFVKQSMGSLNEAEEQVYKVFPFSSMVKRAQNKTFCGNTVNFIPFSKDYSELEGYSYKMGRLYLKYLNKYLTEQLIGGRAYKVGENCNYCPHQDVCHWRFDAEVTGDDQ